MDISATVPMLPPPETDQLTTPRTPKLRGRFWKGTTRYRRKDSEGNIIGKILEPITPEEFAANMEGGKFVKPEHRAFVTLIYYSGVREQEANRVTPENFTVTRTAIFFDVGKRLKHSETTPALKLPLKAPYMGLLKDRIQETPKGQKLFPFSSKTCYNIMYRAGFHYPHLCRLSRITNLFEQGWTVTQVRSWTGLSLSALNYYLGTVDTAKMGDKLS